MNKKEGMQILEEAKGSKKKRRLTSITLEADLLEEIDKRVGKGKINRSFLIQSLLRGFLNSLDKDAVK